VTNKAGAVTIQIEHIFTIEYVEHGPSDADTLHGGLGANEVHHRLASIADDIRHALVDPDAIVRNDRDVKLGDCATVVRVLSTLPADQVRRVVAGCCSKLNLWGRAS